MNGYLVAVIGTVLISAVVTAITPDGKTAAVIKGIAKLICLLSIVAPIPRFLQMLNSDESSENSQMYFSENVIQTDEDFIKYYSEMRVHAVENALKMEIKDKFSIDASVALEWKYDTEKDDYDAEKIRILKMIVQPANEIGEEEKTAMWEYLTKNYCSEVLIE